MAEYMINRPWELGDVVREHGDGTCVVCCEQEPVHVCECQDPWEMAGIVLLIVFLAAIVTTWTMMWKIEKSDE